MGHVCPSADRRRSPLARCAAQFSGTAIAMMNDTEIFDEMRFDVRSGKNVWTGRTGTREAIHRDGHTIDPASQAFCPHEWLDERGYIDIYLAMKHHF
jgi:hypothetical protein